MRKLTLLILVAFSQLISAEEIEKKPHELNEWNLLQAKYKIHSGGTAYSEPPTKADSVITVAIRDEAARLLFEQIGPDVKPVCSDEKGYRLRQKKGVHCSYRDQLGNPANSHYRCWIGIDLRTGEGTVRVSC
jgi:hypothetical protein